MPENTVFCQLARLKKEVNSKMALVEGLHRTLEHFEFGSEKAALTYYRRLAASLHQRTLKLTTWTAKVRAMERVQNGLVTE